ncbi:undecaprenyl-diphosphatase, partial [Candidatus Pacearchaeota archaeon CG_4_9_14_3_um_filter_31_7]
MLTIIQSIILGLIQGITEFIPVSSSAHLAIIEKFWGIQ